MSKFHKYENLYNIILKTLLFMIFYIIGFLLLKVSNIYISILGIIIIISATITIIKLISKKINKIALNNQKFGKIFYTITSIIFVIFFIWQFLINTKDLMVEYAVQSQMNYYTTGTIEKIEENKLIINCIIDKKETQLICEVNNPDNYKEITEEIYIYYDKNDPKICSLTPPTIIKMLYFLLYGIITIITFLLAFFSCKKLYRIYKPKIIKNEVKIKT